MKFSNRQIYPLMTPPESVRTNYPIIIRFSGPNHPIWAGSRLRARSESTDHRPFFRRKSTDATVEIVRNRQARHSYRQITAATRAAKRSGDFPVPCMAGWKTCPPARETDIALKEILEKIGV